MANATTPLWKASLALTPNTLKTEEDEMTQHARASMPRNREVSIDVDDFTLRGVLVWVPSAHDYEVEEVYLHQGDKCMAVDNPMKLGAMHDGEFKSFDHLLRFEAGEQHA